MKLKNPTDKEVRVVYKGVEYKLDPETTDDFSEEVVAHWIKVHEFLKFVNATDTQVNKVVEEATGVDIKPKRGRKPKKTTK